MHLKQKNSFCDFNFNMLKLLKKNTNLKKYIYYFLINLIFFSYIRHSDSILMHSFRNTFAHLFLIKYLFCMLYRFLVEKKVLLQIKKQTEIIFFSFLLLWVFKTTLLKPFRFCPNSVKIAKTNTIIYKSMQ